MGENATHNEADSVNGYELRFDMLCHPGRALSFPCNEAGEVNVDALGDRLRANYLLAQDRVGLDYAHPQVVPMPGRAPKSPRSSVKT